MTTAITNTDDTIDLRDVIARFEEIEEEQTDDEEIAEFMQLKQLLDDCKGHGGDEQWRGDWYPVTLIRDSYFENYAQELAEEVDAVSSDAKWPYTCIDWEKAARELQYDYTSVGFGDVTYWYR
jgi:hypothetical protein